MTGDNIPIPHIQRPVQQHAEFHGSVAPDAGIGHQTGFVAADKGTDDIFLKGILKIHHLKGKPHLLRHGRGIRAVVGAAAGDAVQAHIDTHAGKSLLLHQQGSHAAVHAAAHADEGCF